MLKRYIRFRDEPVITILASGFLASSELVFFEPFHAFSSAITSWPAIFTSVALAFVGILMLQRIRSYDSLAVVVICASGLIFSFLLAACFVLITGYTATKYNPHPVPRRAALGYIYPELIAVLILIFSYRRASQRRREVGDG